MIALMRRLRIEMNGAVSASMTERAGKEYGLNYGVSLPTIRDVINDEGYAPDHELAAVLWRQDIREMKLAALFVEDPALVSAEQMEQWSTDWQGLELPEQSAMQLFWRAPQAVEIAAKWLTDPQAGPFRRLAAYYMIGKNAARLEEIPAVFDGETAERSAAYALREIYRHNPALRKAVVSVLETVPPEVAEEVRWQIEYLPE